MPSPAVANDDSEQLGLATPQFQDAMLSPVALRRAGAANPTLLVSAVQLTTLAGNRGFDSVEALVESAAGVVLENVLYAIASVTFSQADGEAYCYSLALRHPAA